MIKLNQTVDKFISLRKSLTSIALSIVSTIASGSSNAEVSAHIPRLNAGVFTIETGFANPTNRYERREAYYQFAEIEFGQTDFQGAYWTNDYPVKVPLECKLIATSGPSKCLEPSGFIHWIYLPEIDTPDWLLWPNGTVAYRSDEAIPPGPEAGLQRSWQELGFYENFYSSSWFFVRDISSDQTTFSLDFARQSSQSQSTFDCTCADGQLCRCRVQEPSVWFPNGTYEFECVKKNYCRFDGIEFLRHNPHKPKP